jgi:nitrogen regulatory protein PII-like uncharacterized protein
MISDYLNQSLTWKKVTATSDTNENTYSSTTIKGRKESVNKLIRNLQGNEVVVSTLVVTESAVSVNDLIDDQIVIQVDILPDLSGNTNHYEVYLR